MLHTFDSFGFQGGIHSLELCFQVLGSAVAGVDA